MVHPAELTPALSAAIERTRTAGWDLPMRVDPCTQPGYLDAWDLNEADGTRVAIVGNEEDADLIAAALNFILQP